MLTLVSSDGKEFEVEVKVAMKSQLLFHMIEDGCVDGTIPIPNVAADILAMVIEYCKKHVEMESASTSTSSSSSSVPPKVAMELTEWEKKFFEVDVATLAGLLLATHHLEIKRMFDQACQTAVDMMKGKSPEEIRIIFNIENDFTPEEEEAIRKEHAWAFEDKP